MKEYWYKNKLSEFQHQKFIIFFINAWVSEKCMNQIE